MARGPPESRRQDEIALGGQGILQHTQDFHLEFVNLVAFENGSPYAFQAWTDIGKREDRWACLAKQAACKKHDQHKAGNQSPQ